jgi:hypothetical protein
MIALRVSPAASCRVRSTWRARSPSPSGTMSRRRALSTRMTSGLVARRPALLGILATGQRVKRRVGRRDVHPRCTKSSPVLTMRASAPGGSTRCSPSASFAPPIRRSARRLPALTGTGPQRSAARGRGQARRARSSAAAPGHGRPSGLPSRVRRRRPGVRPCDLGGFQGGCCGPARHAGSIATARRGASAQRWSCRAATDAEAVASRHRGRHR